jgi:thiol-disulfide isomerase/thioredoxin
MTAGRVTPRPPVIPRPSVIPAKAGIHLAQLQAAIGLALFLALSTPANTMAQGYDLTPWPTSQPRPTLAATDLQGQRWAWADLRGRAVLLNFWASWCEPCRAEMPSLQTLAELYGPDRLVVLAVNFKEPNATIERYVQRSALALPVLPDPDGAMTRQWGVKVFPTTVLVGADGRVRAVLRGELDWTSQAAARLVEPLLAPAARRVAATPAQPVLP